MLEKQVLQIIKEEKLIEEKDSVVLGVSGGPDSMCLLHLLCELKSKINFEIVVAHVNHLIREDSTEDEEYVENYCKKYKIPVYIKRVDVAKLAKEGKKGLEETGRKIRYDFFEEVLQKTNSNKIATAHNQNDVVETLIMNVLRGSGIAGLKSIEIKRDNKYIRPLLRTTREKIEEYCIEKKLEPRIDSTNFDNNYTRNKIRNIVIPYIKKEFNSNIVDTLNRLSQIARDEDEYIEKQVKLAYNEIICEEYKNELVFDLKKFNEQELVIKRRLILYNITKLLGSTNGIEKIHIEDIIKLCKNNIGNKFLSPNKKIKILVKSGKIFFTKNENCIEKI